MSPNVLRMKMGAVFIAQCACSCRYVACSIDNVWRNSIENVEGPEKTAQFILVCEKSVAPNSLFMNIHPIRDVYARQVL